MVLIRRDGIGRCEHYAITHKLIMGWGGGADLIINILDSAGVPQSVAMTIRV